MLLDPVCVDGLQDSNKNKACKRNLTSDFEAVKEQEDHDEPGELRRRLRGKQGEDETKAQAPKPQSNLPADGDSSGTASTSPEAALTKPEQQWTTDPWSQQKRNGNDSDNSGASYWYNKKASEHTWSSSDSWNSWNSWWGPNWGWDGSWGWQGDWHKGGNWWGQESKPQLWKQTSWYTALQRANTCDVAACKTPKTKTEPSSPDARDAAATAAAAAAASKTAKKREAAALKACMDEDEDDEDMDEEERAKNAKIKKSRARYMRFYRSVTGTSASAVSLFNMCLSSRSPILQQESTRRSLLRSSSLARRPRSPAWAQASVASRGAQYCLGCPLTCYGDEALAVRWPTFTSRGCRRAKFGPEAVSTLT